jgi:hypothetical protein
MLSVTPLSSREVSRRGSGADAALVLSNFVDGNLSRRGNRLFVASPLTLTRRVSPRVSLRTRQVESLCILGGQGYGHARSMARTGKGLAAAAAAGSSAGAEYSLEPNMDPGDSTIGEGPSEEEVTEVQLSGDDTEVREIGESLYSVRTLQKLVFKIGHGSKQFVMNSVGGVVGVFKKDKNKKQPELLAFEASSYESKDGKTALSQWTATELTMQHNQLVRIATDLNYLIFAFAFFGWVRVLEAVLAAFSTQPAKLRELGQASNAMDPLTVAWLAYNLRKPILGILQVDPTDFQKLASLKGKLWEELHAFFERQWKVVCHSHAYSFNILRLCFRCVLSPSFGSYGNLTCGSCRFNEACMWEENLFVRGLRFVLPYFLVLFTLVTNPGGCFLQMATLAMVRFLGMIANNIPASQWITSKVKTLWDVLMMIPIF